MKFIELDIKDVFQLVQLDEPLQELVTISTLKGPFQLTKFPFGVVSVPVLLQWEMDNLLGYLLHVAVYFDNILVTSTNDEEH